MNPYFQQLKASEEVMARFMRWCNAHPEVNIFMDQIHCTTQSALDWCHSATGALLAVLKEDEKEPEE